VTAERCVVTEHHVLHDRLPRSDGLEEIPKMRPQIVTTPVTAHRQMLLEKCFVVAFLFRRILWRRTTRPPQALH